MSCTKSFYNLAHTSPEPLHLINKAVGTILRALFKPPHRCQGTDSLPRLLVEIPSAPWPELAHSLEGA